jgi:4-hydroxy-tetrahydrodipicolinate synthase
MGEANVRRWVPEIMPLLLDGDPLGVDEFVTLSELSAAEKLPWTWLCGLAERWAPFFWLAGARGFTSGLANVEPSVPLALLAALNNRDDAGARALVHAIAPFEALRARRAGAANVGVVKEAMLQRGQLACAHVRPPLSPLPKEEQPVVRAALEHLQPWITPLVPRAVEDEFAARRKG